MRFAVRFTITQSRNHREIPRANLNLGGLQQRVLEDACQPDVRLGKVERKFEGGWKNSDDGGLRAIEIQSFAKSVLAGRKMAAPTSIGNNGHVRAAGFLFFG